MANAQMGLRGTIVFSFRSLGYRPDGSEVPIRVGLQDQRATEAHSRFLGP
jgi:hypothetical protein